MEGIPQEELTAYEKCFIYLYDAIVMYKGFNDIFPTTNHELFKKAYNYLVENNYFNSTRDVEKGGKHE